ncbi:unnamed protein product [Vicia faba]|uniref:Uncharacterized protein n=1 Tax=Vicia faba TaxID=3906 RepID=A0AAV1AVU4_VICFA|nr:unnamed protein product [Vicia faba]
MLAQTWYFPRTPCRHFPNPPPLHPHLQSPTSSTISNSHQNPLSKPPNSSISKPPKNPIQFSTSSEPTVSPVQIYTKSSKDPKVSIFTLSSPNSNATAKTNNGSNNTFIILALNSITTTTPNHSFFRCNFRSTPTQPLSTITRKLQMQHHLTSYSRSRPHHSQNRPPSNSAAISTDTPTAPLSRVTTHR